MEVRRAGLRAAVACAIATAAPRVAAAPAGAPVPAAPSPVVVRDVSIAPGDRPVVRIRLSRPATPSLKELPAADGRPPRAYVDVPGAVVGTAIRELRGAGAVVAVRVGQFDPTTVRVVLDLAAARPVRVDRESDAVVVRIGAPPAGSAPTSTARLVTTSMAATYPVGEAVARPVDAAAALRREVAERRMAGDPAGVVASYAAWGLAATSGLDAVTRAGIADALRQVGLLAEAARVLGDESPGEGPLLRIARAELALASGDRARARRVAGDLGATPPSGTIAAPLARLQARVAIADGDLETAAGIVDAWPDPMLVADVARAWIATGRTAAAARSWDRARAAYDAVLARDVDASLRAAAAAGLAEAALALDDRDAAARALGVLATTSDPVLRRAAVALASEREIGLASAVAPPDFADGRRP